MNAAVTVNDGDIGNCLTSLGIEKRQIIPTNVLRQQRHQPELNQFRNEINIFPLEWFDSGNDNDLNIFMGCREGLAFLPLHQSTSVEINPDDGFEWRKVTIEKYNETANKWRIKELKSGAIYEVPRIYLMFIVEKPLKFAQRIENSLKLRNECETRLKFEAVLDKIVLSEIPTTPQTIRDKIVKLLSHSSNTRRGTEILEWEFQMQHKKTFAALDLIKFLATNPHESIQLPTMAKLKKLAGNNGVERKKIFEKSRRDFQRMWLYSCPQAIKIMEFINNECDVVSRMSLFHIQTTEDDLNYFLMHNNEKLSEISDFLRQKWIAVVVRAVECFLSTAGKGWFDLNLNDAYIYRHSKVRRLIELIKQRMQNAVRDMLRSSLRAFVNHLCRPCMSMLKDVAVDFVWGNDLVTSPFHSSHEIPFSLVLDFDGNQPVFKTDVERFEIEIVEMFEARILTSHDVPHIDSYLVKQLIFERNVKFSSIGFLDEEIQAQIRLLRRCYRTVLIPIRAYAREFQRFNELEKLIIPEYVRGWRESDKTGKEMREEISHQLKCIEKIERSVPTTIIIGPFRISCETMKESLIVKRRKLHSSLLEMFIDKVKENLETAEKEFKGIFAKMTQKCENVEKLVEIRSWIEKVDDEIGKIQSKMEMIEMDIEALEAMFIPLADDVMKTKLSCLKMPSKITQKAFDIQPKLHFDFEQFRKLQAANEAQFHQKIDAFADDVKECLTKHEFEDLSKVSAECDKLWSALNETTEYGEMLNNRQKIFTQPEIDTERLMVLVKRLHPYHTLWTMASNFHRFKESWSTFPLSTVDIEIVEAEMKRCENVLQDSRSFFAAHAEMMALIEKISTVIEAASKTFDVLRDLKNSDFKDKHWAMLSEKTGMRYTPTITFESLIARGIVVNAEAVKDVLKIATSEREAEEFEKIEAERKCRENEEKIKRRAAKLAVRTDI